MMRWYADMSLCYLPSRARTVQYGVGGMMSELLASGEYTNPVS